jgi:fructokinase
MQIGIDLGATKIESVVLSDDGKEHFREREPSPQSYDETINSIKKIVINIEKKFKKKINVGLCHPGAIISKTGKVKNANNSSWLNNRTLQKDISKELNKNVYCENDANCLALSEATDGSAKNYKTVFGLILGSGCGGGLVINKEIITGANNHAGEWGHNPLPYFGLIDDEVSPLSKDSIMVPNISIEKYVSGKGLEDLYFEIYKKKIPANEIFKNYETNKKFINNFYNRLSRSLSTLINTIDPEVIVFGGGLSNEIRDFNLLREMTGNFAGTRNINTVFIKPMYGDASGVRGAARLGRKIIDMNQVSLFDRNTKERL